MYISRENCLPLLDGFFVHIRGEWPMTQDPSPCAKVPTVHASRFQFCIYKGLNENLFTFCNLIGLKSSYSNDLLPRTPNMEPENPPEMQRKLIWTKPSWLGVPAVTFLGKTHSIPYDPRIIQGFGDWVPIQKGPRMLRYTFSPLKTNEWLAGKPTIWRWIFS